MKVFLNVYSVFRLDEPKAEAADCIVDECYPGTCFFRTHVDATKWASSAHGYIRTIEVDLGEATVDD